MFLEKCGSNLLLMFCFFCDQNFGFNPDFVEAVQIFWGFSLETFPLPAAFMAACCALISAKAKTQKSQTKRKLSKADHLCQTRNSEMENMSPKTTIQRQICSFQFPTDLINAHLTQSWNPRTEMNKLLHTKSQTPPKKINNQSHLYYRL